MTGSVIDWFNSPVTDWLTDWVTVWLANWLTKWLTNTKYLIGWLSGSFTGRLNDSPVFETNFKNLTKYQPLWASSISDHVTTIWFLLAYSEFNFPSLSQSPEWLIPKVYYTKPRDAVVCSKLLCLVVVTQIRLVKQNFRISYNVSVFQRQQNV